ncbi:threo-3-hydroxy-L-aspartate ammonia-lyase [Streptomyces albus subsp. chlorinus]|uniref:threo-3-hydroxy-L-aspartate ammonia-lyase n=1 Tax=Streptomyces albus TaxID=1888 RepID=UPI00156F1EC0|nr:threo-3-hydroxy-L-aspartate ammonia-lyase [Streptomyces albus]NSC21669.1 threo-3-hydroxy-L-aspartate ammonia-lyase [Streptomyces albus subsp. chlorinus]
MTDETTQPVLTLDDVRAAAARIEGAVHRTPVVRSRTLDRLVGAEVFLKCENLQRVGAFKFRGAYNWMAQLTAEERRRGVVAYSSGNHAQAVALAAREFGTSAVIVMPADAPAAKLDATAGYGAEVVTYDRYTESREAIGEKIAAERGLTLIPPYDHPRTMAGQGTAALELLEETGELDALLVPVGGGGLIAGCATAARGLYPDLRVIGVEPEAGDDTARSLAAGRRVTIEVPHTVADAQTATVPGALTFEVNRRLVEGVVLVGDDELRTAMRFALERLKLLTEPAGACGLAALLADRVEPLPPRVGVIVSGGNIGLERFIEVMGG